MNTMQDNIEDAIDQNANNIGGQDYDATSTYDVGDIVKYQGQLYICTTAITTAEAWNSNHWQATDVLSSAGGNEIAIGSASDITGKTKIFVEESTQRLKYKDSTTGQFEDIAGDEVFIGDEEDAPDSTKIIVDTEDDSWNNIGTEVVDTLSRNEANRAPSVRAVKEELQNYSTTETRIGTWMGKPLYRKVFQFTAPTIVSDGVYQSETISIGNNIDYAFVENQFYIGANGEHQNLPYISNAGYIIKGFINDRNNYYLTANGIAYSKRNVIVIINYTKTTD